MPPLTREPDGYQAAFAPTAAAGVSRWQAPC